MKNSVTILLVMLALSLVAAASAKMHVAAAAQQPEKLTFKMELCGIGAFQSHQTYTASDGTILHVDLVTYQTPGKAKKALTKELKVARRIDDRKDQVDQTGKKIGKRIIAIVGGADSERTVWLSLENKTLYKIEGASLRHIEEFRKFETQPNTSLDRSAEGVFLNLLD